MVPIIIANWKMHFSLSEASAVCNKLAENKQSSNLIIAPPLPYLAYLAKNFPTLNFAAQNVSHLERDGAYTGEYSATMLKSCGLNYAIVGHSERRSLFNETDEIVSLKANSLSKANITPIICIGESSEVRQNRNYEEFLSKQIKYSLPNATPNIILAYEPIWSIGTDILPTTAQLSEAFEIINLKLAQSEVAKKAHLLYGGSVNLDNIEQILNISYINGVLIGKASLKPEILIKMLERLY